ncbi:MAG: hypothetical protein WBL28_09930 [Methylotenera sp.]
MSDLFNDKEEIDINNAFNANDHIDSLCRNGRIRFIPHGRMNYKKGWAGIVEELINTIKRLPIEITSVSSDYGQLEIGFDCYQKTQEVRVWRAIDQAKYKSRQTCMECGGHSKRKIRGDTIVVICSDCIRIAESNGVTGTWLDRY